MVFGLSAEITGGSGQVEGVGASGNNQIYADVGGGAGQVNFSELLSETIQKASGGLEVAKSLNNIPAGSGALSRGNIVNTGNPLDMAIEGEGFFVLNDGKQNVYSRVGSFAVDNNSNLVDASGRFKVQRIGSVGEKEGFQAVGNSDTKIPYGAVMGAKATSELKISGNLSANAMSSVGGEEGVGISIPVYDSAGRSHVLEGALVRTDKPNVWDMALTSIGGDVAGVDNRRIEGIRFDGGDGSFRGLDGGGKSEFVIRFGGEDGSQQRIGISIGEPGGFSGLTQFSGNSTASARGQDGYGSGELKSVSVNNEGIVVGSFSNGEKRDVASVRVAMFANPAGLKDAGNGYFTSSAEGGEPVASQAMSGGAGIIHGGSLEKSEADVANDFVSMLRAQESFRDNSGTLRAANNAFRGITDLFQVGT